MRTTKLSIFLCALLCGSFLPWQQTSAAEARALQPVSILKKTLVKGYPIAHHQFTRLGVVRRQQQGTGFLYEFSPWRNYLSDNFKKWIPLQNAPGQPATFTAVGKVLVGAFGAPQANFRTLQTWIYAGDVLKDGPARNPSITVRSGCQGVFQQVYSYLVLSETECSNGGDQFMPVYIDGTIGESLPGIVKKVATKLPSSTHWKFDKVRQRNILKIQRAETSYQLLLAPQIGGYDAALMGQNPQWLLMESGTAVLRNGRNLAIGLRNASGNLQWKYYTIPARYAQAKLWLNGRSNLVLVQRTTNSIEFLDLKLKGLFLDDYGAVFLPRGGLNNPSVRFEQLSCSGNTVSSIDARYLLQATRDKSGTWVVGKSSSPVAWSRSRGSMHMRALQDTGTSSKLQVSTDGTNWQDVVAGQTPMRGLFDWDARGNNMLALVQGPSIVYSHNQGRQWHNADASAPRQPAAVALSRQDPMVGFSSSKPSSFSSGLHRTADGGKTWFPVAADFSESCDSYAPIAQHLTAIDNQTLLAASGFSADGGQKWSCPAAMREIGQSITTVHYLPRYAYALIGTENGIYLSNQISEGLTHVQAFPGTENLHVRDLCGDDDTVWVALGNHFGRIQIKKAARQICLDVETSRDIPSSCLTIIPYNTRASVALLDAALQGELPRVQQLIQEENANPSYVSPTGHTAMLMAASSPATDVARYLLQHKATVTGTTKDRRTPVHVAAQLGATKLLDLLLKNGASVSELDQRGWTPLMLAAWAGQGNAVKTLLRYGANARVEADGKSAVEIAHEYGHARLGEALRSYIVTATVKQAHRSGNIRLLRETVERFQAADVRDSKGSPIVLLAAELGNRKIIELLINLGADVGAADRQGLYAHDRARKAGHSQLAVWLEGVTRDARLRSALLNQKYDMATSLVQAGADPNLRIEGRTPLMFAAYASNFGLISALQQAGADPMLKDQENSLALDYAIGTRVPGVVQTIVDGMPDKGPAQDPARLSAQMSNENYAVAEVLIQAGADPNGPAYIRGHRSEDSLIIQAARRGDLKALDVLVRHKADINGRDRVGQTPLMAAVQAASVPTINWLLLHKADPNLQDPNGWTALMFAVTKNRIDIVKILVKAGTDLDLENKSGDSAEDIADDLKFDKIEDYIDEHD